MHNACDQLPEHLRQVEEGRSAAHSCTARYSETKFEGNWRPTLTPEQLARAAEVVHPVVGTHPHRGLALVILIGLLVENLVFDTFERLTVKRWGMPC